MQGKVIYIRTKQYMTYQMAFAIYHPVERKVYGPAFRILVFTCNAFTRRKYSDEYTKYG